MGAHYQDLEKHSVSYFGKTSFNVFNETFNNCQECSCDSFMNIEFRYRNNSDLNSESESRSNPTKTLILFQIPVKVVVIYGNSYSNS